MASISDTAAAVGDSRWLSELHHFRTVQRLTSAGTDAVGGGEAAIRSRANCIALDGHAPRHRTVLDERRNSPHPCLPPARTPGGPIRSDAACSPHPRRPSDLRPRRRSAGPSRHAGCAAMADAASAMATAPLFGRPVRALRRRARAGCHWRYRQLPVVADQLRAQGVVLGARRAFALHLGGAALSFAARPRETLFRITGLRLAR